MDTIELVSKFAPYFIPIIISFGVIAMSRNYIYKGMVPEAWLNTQIERERATLREQSDREKAIIEGAKDIEVRLAEIVRHLESFTKKVSDEIRQSNERITSLEHYLSDQRDDFHELTSSIKTLSFECEKHRSGIPGTQGQGSATTS